MAEGAAYAAWESTYADSLYIPGLLSRGIVFIAWIRITGVGLYRRSARALGAKAVSGFEPAGRTWQAVDCHVPLTAGTLTDGCT